MAEHYKSFSNSRPSWTNRIPTLTSRTQGGYWLMLNCSKYWWLDIAHAWVAPIECSLWWLPRCILILSSSSSLARKSCPHSRWKPPTIWAESTKFSARLFQTANPISQNHSPAGCAQASCRLHSWTTSLKGSPSRSSPNSTKISQSSNSMWKWILW